MERDRMDKEEKGASGPEAGGTPTGSSPADAAKPAEGTGGMLDDRHGPTWRGWVISILAAVILSAAATLLLGGSFRPTGLLRPGVCGTGFGGPCCPPAGK